MSQRSRSFVRLSLVKIGYHSLFCFSASVSLGKQDLLLITENMLFTFLESSSNRCRDMRPVKCLPSADRQIFQYSTTGRVC